MIYDNKRGGKRPLTYKQQYLKGLKQKAMNSSTVPHDARPLPRLEKNLCAQNLLKIVKTSSNHQPTKHATSPGAVASSAKRGTGTAPSWSLLEGCKEGETPWSPGLLKGSWGRCHQCKDPARGRDQQTRCRGVCEDTSPH